MKTLILSSSPFICSVKESFATTLNAVMYAVGVSKWPSVNGGKIFKYNKQEDGIYQALA